MAAHAVERGLQACVKTLQGYLEEAPFHKYDVVLLKEVLHFVPNDERQARMECLLKTMKPGGKLLIITRPEHTDLPFWPAAKVAYTKASPPVQDFVADLRAAGFRGVARHEFDYACTITSAKWAELVRGRFWSHLHDFTDAMLEAGLEQVPSTIGMHYFKDYISYVVAEAPPLSIGAFRDAGKILALPHELASLRTAECDLTDFRLEPGAHLNHGAFGSAMGCIVDLDRSLRKLVDSNPNRFYDEFCLPLLRETVAFASHMLKGRCLLMPNCSIALKGVMEGLGFDATASQPKSVAFLPPIYGATRKLLNHLCPNLTEISVDRALWCEDANVIVAALDAAYAKKAFGFLVADHTASQSGSVLPLAAVVQWCEAHGVVSVIDGTQNPDLDVGTWPD